MDEITITIRETADDCFVYDVYGCPAAQVGNVESLDGGICGTTLESALEAAFEAAREVVRREIEAWGRDKPDY